MNKKQPKAKKVKKETWQRISVWWIDSVSLTRGWKSYSEIKEAADRDYDESYMITCGYKMYENTNYIAIAQSMSFEESEVALFGDIILIPKACIKNKEFV